MLDSLLQDVRYALRGLRRSPGFAITVVLVLALGIGANTAVFSVLDAAIYRPLPFVGAGELVDLSVGPRPFSYALFERLKASPVLADVLASGSADLQTIRLDGTSEPLLGVEGAYASANYFTMLGVRAFTGRVFTDEDSRVPREGAVAVVSYAFWDRQFARDPATVGRTMFLNGVPFTIVGVTQPGFFGDRVGIVRDFWVPILMQPALDTRNLLEARTAGWFRAVGRLQGEATDERAAAAGAQLSAIYQAFRAEEVAAGVGSRNPRDAPASVQIDARPLTGLRPEARPFAMLMAIVGVVLLIACCNIANLLLVRGAARQRDLAIQTAVGATRGRLIRPLVAEALVLAVIGAAAGVVLARWIAAAIVASIAENLGTFDATVDLRVLAFTAAVAVIAAMVFALVPALRATAASRTPGQQALALAGFRGQHTTRMLVVAQVAMSVCLLAGAGLLLRSLNNLAGVDTGVDSSRVLNAELVVEGVPLSGLEIEGIRNALSSALSTIPGVERVAYSSAGHFQDSFWDSPVFVPGAPAPPDQESNVRRNLVSADYFSTLGMALVSGRAFDARDTSGSPTVVVINESLARRYFGQQNPVGQTMYFPAVDAQGRYVPFTESLAGAAQVVGVVRDAKYDSLREEPVHMAYTALAQDATPDTSADLGRLHLRLSSDDAAVPVALRAAVQRVHPRLVLRTVTRLEDDINRTLGSERFFATLLGAFSALALGLAAIGLYGVMAYATRRRTREIGVRMAMGATGAAVVAMVLREALAMALVGVLIGVPAALYGARFMEGLLYGLTAADPLTLVGVVLLIGAVALIAAWLPARRAATVDPNAALRCE